MSATQTSITPAQPRLLSGLRRDGQPVRLAAHVDRYGLLPLELRPEEIRDRIAESGLTGRGGARFPTAAKLDSVLRSRTRPIVVANGVEAEPPSGKDKVLLAYAPHLVLDGAVLAARAVGAKKAMIATTATVHAAVAAAIKERRSDGGVSLSTTVLPDRFVAGEETAVVQFLNGGPALPTFTPPRPYERGVDGAPTVILNVETLAHLALVARFGGAWFRSVGTPEEPGSALVTVSGAVRTPGVHEIELGSPFAHLLQQSGADPQAQAYLVGGYFGTWIDAAHAQSALLSDADLAQYGASLGARAIVVLPAGACGIVETARVARYLAEQSARQCGPCVHGLAAIADSLEQLVHRTRKPPDAGLLRRRLSQVANRGACRHPDGAVAFVASALRVFSTELDRHLHGHRCTGHGRPVLPLP
ncbi:MAG TPA: NADH-ubiquinone oxidoreductase-F iron-sulfur binding region domain-containing protein [Gaiellaceae bacterium]|nr:NADH-ubiquinone oxidoreductase-F iron-sulfur binding region domain-containing protein [Gaiellaceae bacterium]